MADIRNLPLSNKGWGLDPPALPIPSLTSPLLLGNPTCFLSSQLWAVGVKIWLGMLYLRLTAEKWENGNSKILISFQNTEGRGRIK
jgi:hypothetical protein